MNPPIFKFFLRTLRRFLPALITSISLSAFAYIPPATFIVQKMVKKRQNSRTMRIKARVIALADGRPTEAQFTAVTTWDSANGSLEGFAMDESGQRLFTLDRRAAGLQAALALDSSNERLAGRLKSAGIPIPEKLPLPSPIGGLPTQPMSQNEPTTLARWKGAAAWVLGDYRKPREPQLWVEKDTFLPLRMLLSGGGGCQDVRLESFRFHREVPYPHLISCANAEAVVSLQAETIDVAINPSPLSPAIRGSSIKAGFSEAGAAAPAAVRDLITAYYSSLQ